MARALIVGCGCSARALGSELRDEGWEVRGTSREEEGLAALSVGEDGVKMAMGPLDLDSLGLEAPGAQPTTAATAVTPEAPVAALAVRAAGAVARRTPGWDMTALQ